MLKVAVFDGVTSEKKKKYFKKNEEADEKTSQPLR